MVLGMDSKTGLSSAARTRMGGAEEAGASGWIAWSVELVVNSVPPYAHIGWRRGNFSGRGRKGERGSETFEERRQGRRRQPKKLRYGSGRRPLQSIHAHTTAVSDPKAPATSPMVRGPTYCEAMPAADMETIMTLQRIDSMVLNTRPRNWRSEEHTSELQSPC